MTDEDVKRAEALVDRWEKWFQDHGHNSHPYLTILFVVIRYVRYLQARLEELEPKPHMREGWWSRFKNLWGDL